MAGENDNLVPQSYRLPQGQVDFIDLLVKKRIFGTNRSDVVRALLSFQIKELTESEFVRKHLETQKLLKGK